MDATRFGRSVRALRRRKRWRQQDLTSRAGISQSEVSRVELGHADALRVHTLQKIAGALEARLDLRLFWNGEGLDRLLDADHAALVNRVVAKLETAGWLTASEVSFAIAGERGSIDVLGFHPETQSVLVVEVKSVVPDLQAMLSAIDRKARLARLVGRDRGWLVGTVSRLLILAEATTTRRRVEQHAAIFRSAFPIRGRDVDRWLHRPVGRIAGLQFVPVTRATGGKQRMRVRQARLDREPRSISAR